MYFLKWASFLWHIFRYVIVIKSAHRLAYILSVVACDWLYQNRFTRKYIRQRWSNSICLLAKLIIKLAPSLLTDSGGCAFVWKEAIRIQFNIPQSLRSPQWSQASQKINKSLSKKRPTSRKTRSEHFFFLRWFDILTASGC